MFRLAGLLVLLLISFLVWIVKTIVGNATENKKLQNTTLKQQTQKTMDATARSLTSLESMWEQAKKQPPKW